ncbi:JmjC domain-containing protein [Shinella sp.]|uniref:JmjC domain-containing protein n=1 Tax=Shinella sp. TaxID=1870904 RepID=UPI0029AE25BD|nr:cupin domain-containing protein [Shinella sp.]MDX3977156.1 cupin domain-containing protein [Shinella sp.]
MPHDTIVEKLFAPISAIDLIDSLIESSPLMIEGPRNKFSDIFSLDEFWSALPSAYHIRAVMPELRQATIRYSDARDMFESGATLCVSGLERTHSKLQNVASRLQEEIGYLGAVEVKAYLSPSGAGFAPHYDPRTVTTLQIAGEKCWNYANRPTESMPLANSPFPLPAWMADDKVGTYTSSVVLKPGDLLCLPPGTVHSASASGTSLALNVSFEYIGESIADRFCSILRDRLMQESNLRKVLMIDNFSNKKTHVYMDGLMDEILSAVNRHVPLVAEELKNTTLIKSKPDA